MNGKNARQRGKRIKLCSITLCGPSEIFFFAFCLSLTVKIRLAGNTDHFGLLDLDLILDLALVLDLALDLDLDLALDLASFAE